MGRVRTAWAAVVVISVVATLVVVAVPAVHGAYRSATLHAVMETAAAIVAILATFLIVGRLRRGAGRDELLLACGLGLLALSSVYFVLAVTLASTRAQGHLDWVGRIDIMLGALVLGVAAGTPHRQLRRPRRANLLAATGVVVTAAVTVAAVAVLDLPNGVHVASGGASWPSLHPHAVVLVLHSVAAAAFLVASIGFLRRAERLGDAFFGWLSVALALASAAHLNYLVFPSRFTDWVYTGDVFRLLAYLVLLIGTMWEIRNYWQSLSRAAILDERRRIARDLHDGLAQEIAYIQRNLPSLGTPDEKQGERLARVQRAVERAQLESRKTFVALAAPPDEPLDVILQRAATEVANRFGAELELDLVPAVRIDPESAESVVRIACEAVANAARHSGSDRIALSLDRNGRGLRLRVRDYGRGFDPSMATDGFGLISMRERATAIGAELRIESDPGRGTTVEFRQ